MGHQLHHRHPKDFVVEVLTAFNAHQLPEDQACELLGLKRARLYRLRAQWLAATQRGQCWEPGRRPGRQEQALPSEVQAWLREELEYIRREAGVFRGKFNFAFLAEQAEQKFKRSFQRNTLRRFALQTGLYQGLPQEVAKPCVRFETAGPGMLFQHDASLHVWMPTLKAYQALIMTKDDYSRQVVGALLVGKETAFGHLRVAEATVGRFGRPQAYYVDNHSFFRFPGAVSRHHGYRKRADEGAQQFKRALASLEIGLIFTARAHPQAKGKIEKQFDYFQRRLPYLCEKHHVRRLEEANRILTDLVAYYDERHVHAETQEIPKQRWDRAIREGRGPLRPIPADANLGVIFALHYERVVRDDGTISFMNRPWRVGQLVGERVTVAYHPPVRLTILHQGQKLWDYRL